MNWGKTPCKCKIPIITLGLFFIEVCLTFPGQDFKTRPPDLPLTSTTSKGNKENFKPILLGIYQKSMLAWLFIKHFPILLPTNISSVVESKRWWVLKYNIFAQESTCTKEIVWEYWEHQFVKKCQNRTFKVNFLCQKSMDFFQKKII